MTNVEGLKLFEYVEKLRENGVLGFGETYDEKRNFLNYTYIHVADFHIMLENDMDGTVVHVTRHDRQFSRVERFLDDKGSKRLLCLVNKKQLAELCELAKEREVVEYEKEKEYIYTLAAE